MSRQDDIWRHLQNYELPPPAETYERLQQQLQREETASAGSSLQQLQAHFVEPPAGALSAIERMIYGEAGLPGLQPARKNVRWSRITVYAAAACLLLAVAVWAPRRSGHANRVRESLGQRKRQPPAYIKDSIAAATPIAAAAQRDSAAPAAAPAAGINRKPVPSLRIGGRYFTLIDNDVIATFSDFRYEEAPDFLLQEEDREVKVHLDQYTDLIISSPMAGMLKEMYKLKPNGDPTRKARRQRRTLEKWKKADLEYFDGTKRMANPLDPLDLGQFIFK